MLFVESETMIIGQLGNGACWLVSTGTKVGERKQFHLFFREKKFSLLLSISFRLLYCFIFIDSYL